MSVTKKRLKRLSYIGVQGSSRLKYFLLFPLPNLQENQTPLPAHDNGECGKK